MADVHSPPDIAEWRGQRQPLSEDDSAQTSTSEDADSIGTPAQAESAEDCRMSTSTTDSEDLARDVEVASESLPAEKDNDYKEAQLNSLRSVSSSFFEGGSPLRKNSAERAFDNRPCDDTSCLTPTLPGKFEYFRTDDSYDDDYDETVMHEMADYIGMSVSEDGSISQLASVEDELVGEHLKSWSQGVVCPVFSTAASDNSSEHEQTEPETMVDSTLSDDEDRTENEIDPDSFHQPSKLCGSERESPVADMCQQTRIHREAYRPRCGSRVAQEDNSEISQPFGSDDLLRSAAAVDLASFVPAQNQCDSAPAVEMSPMRSSSSRKAATPPLRGPMRRSLRHSRRREERRPQRSASDAGAHGAATTVNTAGSALDHHVLDDASDSPLEHSRLTGAVASAGASHTELRGNSRLSSRHRTRENSSTGSSLSSDSRRLPANLRVSFDLHTSEPDSLDEPPEQTPEAVPETLGNSIFYVSPPWNRLDSGEAPSEADTTASSDGADGSYAELDHTRVSRLSSNDDENAAAEQSEIGSSASGGDSSNLYGRFREFGRRLLGPPQPLVLSAEEEERREERGVWTHNYSCMMACLTCTVGTGAVCRFALFGGTYGVAFVLQFGILSLVLGIPLMSLHMAMGQYLGAGMLDLWKIAPIFKGVGVAAIVAELLMAVYTVVPTAWMFVYLRDSFVSSYDRYKWATCPGGNCTSSYTETITYSVPQYLTTRVLQRNMSNTGMPETGSLGFEISFNLAVLWILVYLSLGRGVRFYGKVVYAFVLLSVTSFIIVCIQLLSWTEGLNEFFTDKVLFDNVFWRKVPWVAAAREAFLVWGLHGAALMAVASHNKYRHNLARDTTLVAFVTLVVLYLSALFGYACLHALRVGDAGYIIGSSSFETEQRSRFLIAPGIGSSHSGGTPPEVKHYTNLVSGVIIRLGGPGSEGTQSFRSGYQVHRLATELFPSLLAVVGGSGISSFWALVFYLALILFGIGQQLVIWRAVVEAVISAWPRKLRAWELTTTFVMCVVGFGLSLPLMTEIGIHVIYFMDYCVGCIWWLALVYALELVAVFYIRGSPFNCGQLVGVLFSSNNCLTRGIGLLLSATWHALSPALLTLAVVSYRTGDFGAIFNWEEESGYGFWRVWTRQIGAAVMLTPLALVVLVALLQTIYYLARPRMPFGQRVRRLFHPPSSDAFLERDSSAGSSEDEEDDDDNEDEEEGRDLEQAEPRRQHHTTYSDPPPKYTPPPSYGTATGARIAKAFRQSMRRSMRRLRQMTSGTSSAAATSSAAPEPTTSRSQTATGGRAVPSDPPPSYASLAFEQPPLPFERARPLESQQRRFSISDSVEALVAHRGAAAAGHQRSVSLGVPPLEPPVRPATCRSLPRDLTPEQVRDILRSGRLRPPEPATPPAAATPRPLSRQQVRQVLRGGISRTRSRAENFELTGTVVEEVPEEFTGRHA